MKGRQVTVVLTLLTVLLPNYLAFQSAIYTCTARKKLKTLNGIMAWSDRETTLG